jgi:hypothetical protein
MRSKISTFASTAMPIDSANPASPGSVSVNPNAASPPRTVRHVEPERADREQPGVAVVHAHDEQHESDGEQRRAHAFANRVGTERRSDRTLLD